MGDRINPKNWDAYQRMYDESDFVLENLEDELSVHTDGETQTGDCKQISINRKYTP